jgi:hypothetical protein
LERSISGISRSASSSSVCIAFALRGAPCGNDPRHWARRGDYHEEHSSSLRPPDDSESQVCGQILRIALPESERTPSHGLGLFERDAVFSGIDARFPRVPVVPRHRGTVAGLAYPGLTGC